MSESQGSEGLARAGSVVVSADEVLGPSEVRWDGGGRIVAVEPAGELTAAERATTLAPGFVNAHAHLDLGGLASLGAEVRPSGDGPGFVDWVGRVVGSRAGWTDAERHEGLRHSALTALAAGTTSVIDIDSTGWDAGALGPAAPRVVRCIELLDASPSTPDERTAAALDALARAEAPGEHPTGTLLEGLSPHGTHTVGDALFEAVGARVAGSSGLVCAVHWAETPEEVRWLAEGSGPFASWLGESPHCGGIERLARAGVLPGALLIHGNHPGPGDARALAAADAAVVHCPGSHAYFGRPPFPFEDFRAEGVRVLLGTDSLASNPALDMAREARLAMETLPLGARDAWRMVTEWPAGRLPWPEVTGRLEVGAAADLVRHRPVGGPVSSSVGDLLAPSCEVVEVWVGGCSILRRPR